MQHPKNVAVIGAGMAGIACARALSAQGVAVTLFDKGRVAGGRMATRPGPEGAIFDHGAQILPEPRDPGFAAALRDLRDQDLVAPWPDRDGLVGRGGMARIPQALSRGLDIRQGLAVTALARRDGAWHLGAESGVTHSAAQVVLTLPAPQARDLLGPDHPLSPALQAVRYDPCVTLMAGLRPEAPRPFSHRAGQGASAWLSQDGTRPGRGAQPFTAWVMQADPDWSLAHVDLDRQALADLMLPPLLRAIGARPEDVVHAAAHRWLYARTATPLGRPFLADEDAGLVVGGDWALGDLAEHAWISGSAMAAHLIGVRA